MKDDLLFLLSVAVWGLLAVTLIGIEASVIRDQMRFHAPVRNIDQLGTEDEHVETGPYDGMW